ncbi:MAG: hypothetical protein WAK89_04905 [Candidatus Sulfotelmatobacter sp.]
MSLHGSARHLELAGNLGVVTTLEKQFDNLLLSRSKPNGLLRHLYPLGLVRQHAKTLVELGRFHVA